MGRKYYILLLFIFTFTDVRFTRRKGEIGGGLHVSRENLKIYRRRPWPRIFYACVLTDRTTTSTTMVRARMALLRGLVRPLYGSTVVPSTRRWWWRCRLGQQLLSSERLRMVGRRVLHWRARSLGRSAVRREARGGGVGVGVNGGGGDGGSGVTTTAAEGENGEN